MHEYLDVRTLEIGDYIELIHARAFYCISNDSRRTYPMGTIAKVIDGHESTIDIEFEDKHIAMRCDTDSMMLCTSKRNTYSDLPDTKEWGAVCTSRCAL